MPKLKTVEKKPIAKPKPKLEEIETDIETETDVKEFENPKPDFLQCPNCSVSCLLVGDKFCSNCGMEIEWE